MVLQTRAVKQIPLVLVGGTSDPVKLAQTESKDSAQHKIKDNIIFNRFLRIKFITRDNLDEGIEKS